MSTNNMFLWRTVENYPLIITKYPSYLFQYLGHFGKTIPGNILRQKHMDSGIFYCIWNIDSLL